MAYVYAFPGLRSPALRPRPIAILSACLAAPAVVAADAPTAPPATQALLHDIGTAPSAERIESDIRKLVSFGTRHTLSDTKSDARGIGAARRWIHAEFERISAQCGGCLAVIDVGDTISGEERIERKRVVEGKSVSVSVDLGGRRILQTKQQT